MAKFLLSMVCSPALEESVLDLLLELAGDDVFTSSPAASHGMAHTQLDVQEQVLGRSASAHIQIIVEEAELPPLLSSLKSAFKGTGIRYWVTPVAFDGEI
jgi:hypothetical protein